MEKYEFKIDQERQKTLEDRIELIITEVWKTEEKTIEEKSESDELIKADVISHDIIIEKAQRDVYIVTEEGKAGDKKSDIVEIWDPIDGSSEFNRIGRKMSPLTTAGLVIHNNKIISASIGDIWNNKIYGLDEKGLYFREFSKGKNYLSINEEKRKLLLEKAFVAAYAPTFERLKIVLPLFGIVPYVHNNGGQPFALRVVEGQSVKTYAAALESKPVGLWEHIGPLMAEYAGAFVSKLDGTPLELDIETKQTSITAVNDDIRQGIINALKENYEKLGIAHTKKTERR